MVNILLVTHFEIAAGFASCLEHILAKKVENLHIVPVKKTEDTDGVINKVTQFINNIGQKSKVLILVDIFGATPSNIASKLIKKGAVELIAGLNLPMLLRAVTYSDQSLDTCVKKALEGALSGIIHMNGD